MAVSPDSDGRSSVSPRDPLLRLVMWWTALVAGVLVWLPLVRGATQGAAYQWVLADGIGARGVGGDYWLLVLAAPLVFTVLYLGWRGARLPFHALLLVLHVPLAAAVAYAASTHPEAFRFEGATIGVSFSLAQIGPVLFGTFAMLSIVWVARDLKAGRSRALASWTWTRATRIRLMLVVALLPVEVALFRTGGIQSTGNVIGVALVFWQWFMINRVLASSRTTDAPLPP
jgi:hypothetical protein